MKQIGELRKNSSTSRNKGQNRKRPNYVDNIKTNLETWKITFKILRKSIKCSYNSLTAIFGWILIVTDKYNNTAEKYSTLTLTTEHLP